MKFIGFGWVNKTASVWAMTWSWTCNRPKLRPVMTNIVDMVYQITFTFIGVCLKFSMSLMGDSIFHSSWSMVHVKAWCLMAPKPLPDPMLHDFSPVKLCGTRRISISWYILKIWISKMFLKFTHLELFPRDQRVNSTLLMSDMPFSYLALENDFRLDTCLSVCNY